MAKRKENIEESLRNNYGKPLINLEKILMQQNTNT